MFKNKLVYQTALAAVLSTTLAVQPLMLAKALADGGDFALDFTAAAPLTYNHATGGGAYNDRTVWKRQRHSRIAGRR
jgi:hypothetical protein